MAQPLDQQLIDRASTAITGAVKGVLGTLGLDDRHLKAVWRNVTNAIWPEKMLPWSNIDRPIIEEVQKASVGSAGVLTFEDKGTRYVVMLEAGDHYDFMKADKSKPHYMVSGGFINLAIPESPQQGAAREIGEELRSDKDPLLDIKPERLKPLNSMSIISPNDPQARNVLMSHTVELDKIELGLIKDHIAKLASNPAYKAGVLKQTEHQGKSEICGVHIIPLKELAEGKHQLLHKDQYQLFKDMQKHYQECGIGIV